MRTKIQTAITGPPLRVMLVPAEPDAQKNIPYIDVEIAIDGLNVKAKQPFLELPLVSANVQGIADKLTNVRVRDATGALHLTAHDDPPNNPAGAQPQFPQARLEVLGSGKALADQFRADYLVTCRYQAPVGLMREENLTDAGEDQWISDTKQDCHEQLDSKSGKNFLPHL